MKKFRAALLLLFLTFQFNAFGYEQVSDFSYFDIKGKKHSFSENKGKWVLVNYWASYCPPCLAEMPDIDRFYLDNKNKFTVLGLDAGGSDIKGIVDFKKKYRIHYPLIPMQESTMLAFGIIMGIPTSYIISPKGEIVEKYVGIITYDDLDYFVNPPIYEDQVSQK